MGQLEMSNVAARKMVSNKSNGHQRTSLLPDKAGSCECYANTVGRCTVFF